MRSKEPISVTTYTQNIVARVFTRKHLPFLGSTLYLIFSLAVSVLLFYASLATVSWSFASHTFLCEGTRPFDLVGHCVNLSPLTPSVNWVPQMDYETASSGYDTDSTYPDTLSVGSDSTIRSESTLRSEASSISDFLASQRDYLGDHNHLVKLLEDVGLFALQFSRSRNHVDMLAAATVFVKLRTNKSILLDSSNLLAQKIEALFGSEVHLQSLEEYVNTSRGVLKSTVKVRNSAIIKKFEVLLMYCLSFGALDFIGLNLDTLNYSKVEKAYVERKYKADGTFVYNVLDMLIFLAETGVQLNQGAKPWEILHGQTSYETFLLEFRKLKEEAKVAAEGRTQSELYRGDSQLMDDLSKAVYDVKCMTAKAKALGLQEFKTMRELEYDVIACYDNVSQRVLSNKKRKAPFGILVTGDSSIGKTSFMDILYQSYGKTRNLPTGDEYIFKRDPTSDFWDGFDSSKWCVVLDDVAFRRPEKVESDHSVDELISIINNIPFMPNQAALEKKGRTPLLSELVIASSNTRDMAARHYFSYPKAVWRRLPIVVHLSVKPEFRDPDGSSLKVPPGFSGPADFWNIDVELTKTEGASKLCKPVLTRYRTMKDFLVFYSEKILEHNSVQKATIHSAERLRTSNLCDACGILDMYCSCESVVTEVPIETEPSAEPQSLYEPVAYIALGVLLREIVSCLLKHVTAVAVACAWSTLRERFLLHWGTTQQRVGIVGRLVSTRIYKRPLALLTFIGVLTTVLYIYKSTRPYMSQGAAESTPQPQNFERYNAYDDTWSAPSCFVSARSASTHEEHLQQRVRENTCLLHFDVGHGVFKARGLVVSSNCVLMNKHLYKSEATSLSIYFGKNGTVQESLVGLPLSSLNYVEEADKDLVMLQIPSMRPFRSIVQHFVEDNLRGSAIGHYLVRDVSGEVKQHDVGKVDVSTIPVPSLRLNLNVLKGTPKNPTYDGMCGSPLMIKCGSHSLIGGIHSVGIPPSMFTQGGSGATIVTRQSVLRMLGKLEKASLTATQPLLQCADKEYTVQSLHHKSVFRYMEGTATVMGSLNGFKSSPKSKVVKTILADAYVSLGGRNPNFGAPIMSGYGPWRNAALKLVDPVKGFASADINWAVDDLWDKIVTSGVSMSHVEKYNLNVAVNGAPGVAFVDGINRKSSAGFPWRKTKRAFFSSVEPFGDYADPIEPNPEIQERVLNIEAQYKRGELFHPVFIASLKDEPVTQKKIADQKTRVFCGAPIDWSLVVRKYFLGHVRTIQNNKTIFECAVGTVAQSAEWGVLYEHVTRFGDDRIVAGDYSAFDKRMPPAIILGAFEILIRMATNSGHFDDEDVRVLWGIAYDTAYPTVDFNGDLVQFWGSNPSGHPLTVIINSLANSIYMRLAYKDLVGTTRTFSDDVSLLTYGDDNIMSVRTGVPFGHTDVAAYFASKDIGYTMADKEAESIPFIHISQASFLKRTWVFDDDVCGYLAPLEETSIHKMICSTVTSSSITEEEQCAEVIISAHSEYFFYGKAVFKEKDKLFKKLIAQTNLEDWFAARPLPTWGQLVQRWDVSTKRVGLEPVQRQ